MLNPIQIIWTYLFGELDKFIELSIPVRSFGVNEESILVFPYFSRGVKIDIYAPREVVDASFPFKNGGGGQKKVTKKKSA